MYVFFFFQAEDGIRDLVRSRGLGDVYKRQGRFIYLTFSNNRDMPAIYSVDDEGNESLINTSVIDSNTIVIQRMVPRLMLRKGKAVASVINKSFDMNGGTDNKTGTVAKDVQRVIKGAQ